MAHPFVHLRVHSDYTMGRGATKPKSLVKKAVAHGQPALALTDFNNLHGAMEFAKGALAENLQPIMGAEILSMGGKDHYGSLILLGQSDVGYANVCRLVNAALDPSPLDPRTFDAPDANPRHDRQHKAGVLDQQRFTFLRERAAAGDGSAFEGVIGIAGGGDAALFAAAYGTKDVAAGVQLAKMYDKLMPKRFYIEICRNETPREADIERETFLLEIARQTGLPIVATTAVFYDDIARHRTHDILLAVASGRQIVTEIETYDPPSPARFHLRSDEEMRELFWDLPEAYEQTSVIARRCGFSAPARNPILPPFPCEGGRTEDQELTAQSEEGLEDRFAAMKVQLSDEEKTGYRERLAYELGIIIRMQFPGYFLIVGDFIKWAKSQDIPVGPGRGSGAGSLVAWALTITDIDPLPFGLLFERFLNPERVSMPDFDIDICTDRRDEVIQYVGRKYGIDKVAQIATFTGIKSKTALKDAARVTKLPDGVPLSPFKAAQLSGQVPKDPAKPAEHLKLADAYKTDKIFKDAVDRDDAHKAAFKNALYIEGLTRGTSAHAAGVIIGGDRLTKFVPAGFDEKTGFPVVQFNMKDAETSGLVKFDFLGLTTLSILKRALGFIREMTGEEIDLSTLPFDDAKTYAMLAAGKSNGVFQLESDGMKRVLLDIKPTQIEDLIAAVALFRPGPMASIPHYAACKNGQAKPDYPQPVERTKPFLEETYGIMVYQEQVMQLAQVVAGYSLGGADLLRRAIGKKIKEEMDKQEDLFVQGAIGQGTKEPEARRLFDLIKKFADYGFNKSHAAAYAVISYHTAWVKQNYPAAFYAAVMTYESDKSDKLALYHQDLEDLKIKLLPPDINKSDAGFRPEQRADGGWDVRFGLAAIKGISEVDAMLAARGDAPFKDLNDFARRGGRFFNAAQLQKIVESTACDSISPYKKRVLTNDFLALAAKEAAKAAAATTSSLFGENDAELRLDPSSVKQKAEWEDKAIREFNSTGFFFTGHPVDMWVDDLARHGGVRRRSSIITHLINTNGSSRYGNKLLGVVMNYKKFTRDNEFPTIQIQLAEREETYAVKYFPPADEGGMEVLNRTYQIVEDAYKSKEPVIVHASVTYNDRQRKYFVNANEILPAVDYAKERCSIESVLTVSVDWNSNFRVRGVETAAAAQERKELIRRLQNELTTCQDKTAKLDELWEAIKPDIPQMKKKMEDALKPLLVTDEHVAKAEAENKPLASNCRVVINLPFEDMNEISHARSSIELDGRYFNGEMTEFEGIMAIKRIRKRRMFVNDQDRLEEIPPSTRAA